MELELVSRLVFSLVVGHTVHAVSEARGIRAKLRGAESAATGRPAPPSGIEIETKIGALAVGLVFVASLSALAFAAAWWLHASPVRLLEGAVGLLVSVEMTTTALYDGYHRRMDALCGSLTARRAGAEAPPRTS